MKNTIYARTLNPECFDYRVYDIREDDGNEVIIDGGRDFSDIDQKDYLKAIKKLLNEYGNTYSYENCYQSSIKAFLNDMLPKKENGKPLSPKEMGDIRVTLDLDDDEEVICKCLSIITGKPYAHKGLRGCCQGDYVEAYYPVENGIIKYLDYVEAWYFGTGTEVEIHEDEKEPECAEDVTGYTFYTASWKTEDLVTEIKQQCGYKAEDDVEVKLWLYKDTRTVHIDQYELATE